MSTINTTAAHAVADATEGQLLACMDIQAEPERVFRALTSQEITAWWVRPGVFDTRQWSGDVRVGGRWRAAGVSRGQPYVQEGEFLEIDPPHKLVHTWDGAGTPAMPFDRHVPLRAVRERNAPHDSADRLHFARCLQRVRYRMGDEPQAAR